MKMAFFLFFVFVSTFCHAQTDCENKSGAWIWYVELTGMENHQNVADSLSSVGIKRVYTKVADGSVDSTWWPELVDRELIEFYHQKNMEIWAWSYNYPENDLAQAEALYLAAKTGYDGYVVDVESQFDGKAEPLSSLFVAFNNAKEQAIQDGYITDEFKIYCTTWGNPKDHNFRIDLIDPWVDGYMPQTYVEIWSGGALIDDLEYWIEVGTEEYVELGATKPIHHMTATENNIMTGDELNRFMIAAGPEFSVWRIPGGGTPDAIWDDWNEVDWDYDFCQLTNSSTEDLLHYSYNILANPIYDQLVVQANTSTGNTLECEIIDLTGRILAHHAFYNNNSIFNLDVSILNVGSYFLRIKDDEKISTLKFSKIQ